MPRLLLLLEFSSLNGGERSLLAVMDRILESDLEVVAALPGGPLSDLLQQRGVATQPFDTYATADRPNQSALRRRLGQMLQGQRADLVHANSLAMARLAGPVCREQGLPCLGHLRDIMRLSKRATGDLNEVTRLLAVSQATLDWYVRLGVAGDRLQVLYNGVDLDQFQPREATGYLRRELRLSKGTRLIGCIGQIGIRKGQDVLIDAATRISDSHSDLHFVIVGQRYSQKAEAVEFDHTLRRRVAEEEALRGRVHFLGRREDVHEMLNELTLLVHPARQEPLGRVLLEAAASGLAVVATDVGGTREVFSEGTAVLVAPNDADSLAVELTKLLDQHKRRIALGRRARERAEERFDRCQSAVGLLGHYRQLLAKGTDKTL